MSLDPSPSKDLSELTICLDLNGLLISQNMNSTKIWRYPGRGSIMSDISIDRLKVLRDAREEDHLEDHCAPCQKDI
jgi:hypothetical protein